jgi:hypothetical protein
VRSQAEKLNNRSNNSSIEPSFGKRSAATDRRVKTSAKIQRAPENTEAKNIGVMETTLAFVQQAINLKKPVRKRSLKRKLAFNPDVDTFYSPYVDIRIINKISHLK